MYVLYSCLIDIYIYLYTHIFQSFRCANTCNVVSFGFPAKKCFRVYVYRFCKYISIYYTYILLCFIYWYNIFFLHNVYSYLPENNLDLCCMTYITVSMSNSNPYIDVCSVMYSATIPQQEEPHRQWPVVICQGTATPLTWRQKAQPQSIRGQRRKRHRWPRKARQWQL